MAEMSVERENLPADPGGEGLAGGNQFAEAPMYFKLFGATNSSNHALVWVPI